MGITTKTFTVPPLGVTPHSNYHLLILKAVAKEIAIEAFGHFTRLIGTTPALVGHTAVWLERSGLGLAEAEAVLTNQSLTWTPGTYPEGIDYSGRGHGRLAAVEVNLRQGRGAVIWVIAYPRGAYSYIRKPRRFEATIRIHEEYAPGWNPTISETTVDVSANFSRIWEVLPVIVQERLDDDAAHERRKNTEAEQRTKQEQVTGPTLAHARARMWDRCADPEQMPHVARIEPVAQADGTYLYQLHVDGLSPAWARRIADKINDPLTRCGLHFGVLTEEDVLAVLAEIPLGKKTR